MNYEEMGISSFEAVLSRNDIHIAYLVSPIIFIDQNSIWSNIALVYYSRNDVISKKKVFEYGCFSFCLF